MMAHIRNKLNGGGDGRRKIKGKTAYLWYVPWTRKNNDELQTPRHERGRHRFEKHLYLDRREQVKQHTYYAL